MIMKVFLSKKEHSEYSLIFIHGWGVNEKSLYPLAKLFFKKYDCHLITLSGFDGNKLAKVYTIDDYVNEIKDYIINNNLKNIVVIGHSFGGKIAFFLKLIMPEIKIITLAPSIRKNPFSLKIFLKIHLYKLLKFLHFPIPKILKGSKDYQQCKDDNIKKTFLNVFHKYLTNDEISSIEGHIIAFKNDKEVNIKSLQKISSSKIKVIILEGNHFGYLDSLLDVYHIIRCALKTQHD